ncbi:hypothetical protein FKM82_028182 [Ascaphus truei]
MPNQKKPRDVSAEEEPLSAGHIVRRRCECASCHAFAERPCQDRWKPLPGRLLLTDNNRTLVLPSAEARCWKINTLTLENSYCKTSVSHDLLVTAPESPHKRHRFFLIPAIFPCAVFALIVYI